MLLALLVLATPTIGPPPNVCAEGLPNAPGPLEFLFWFAELTELELLELEPEASADPPAISVPPGVSSPGEACALVWSGLSDPCAGLGLGCPPCPAARAAAPIVA